VQTSSFFLAKNWGKEFQKTFWQDTDIWIFIQITGNIYCSSLAGRFFAIVSSKGFYAFNSCFNYHLRLFENQ
jgi:hypothetical protein